MLDEEFQVALPADHRLAGLRRVSLSDLCDEVWIEGGYPDCLGPLLQLAEALGGSPRIGFFCEDWNGRQALVAGGTRSPMVGLSAGRPVDSATPAQPRISIFG
ncbi:LysR substrate-binding domain-containing protein [Streptosporangium sp. NPDC000509]|uniref:LysR substrate-binding domain-containing protein n=1 Tax=Streptosporangium sp. NPDC000509 TaxID=3366186 RepID=UPI00368EC06A